MSRLLIWNRTMFTYQLIRRQVETLTKVVDMRTSRTNEEFEKQLKADMAWEEVETSLLSGLIPSLDLKGYFTAQKIYFRMQINE